MIIKIFKSLLKHLQVSRTLLDVIDTPKILYLRNNKLKNMTTMLKYGGSKLNSDTLYRHKKSDTLFILATGSSINDYGVDFFNHVKKHTSLSIGDWHYHEFVPDIITYEIMNNFDPLVDLNQSNMFLKLKKNYRLYQNSTFIFKARVPREKSSVDLVTFCFQNFDSFWSDTRIIFANNQKKLAQNLLILDKFRMLVNNTKHIQYQGSLIWSILIAYKLDFKKIVLCGVDLEGPYFYESSNLHTNHHPSFEKSLKLVNIIESLRIIDSRILRPKGIKIYIGTYSNKLNRYFDEYHI